MIGPLDMVSEVVVVKKWVAYLKHFVGGAVVDPRRECIMTGKPVCADRARYSITGTTIVAKP